MLNETLISFADTFAAGNRLCVKSTSPEDNKSNNKKVHRGRASDGAYLRGAIQLFKNEKRRKSLAARLLRQSTGYDLIVGYGEDHLINFADVTVALRDAWREFI